MSYPNSSIFFDLFASDKGGVRNAFAASRELVDQRGAAPFAGFSTPSLCVESIPEERQEGCIINSAYSLVVRPM